MLKIALTGLLALAALTTTGARCVKYVWTSPVDEATFAGAIWNDTPLVDGEYHFDPDLPTTEINVGFCYDDRFRESLVHRGGLGCQAYVLDIETQAGTQRVTNIETLLELVGPIESELEAASFAKATINVFGGYEGVTATSGDVFFVRMEEVLYNCSPAAGFYSVAYEIVRDGTTRRIAEEAPKPDEQGALCID